MSQLIVKALVSGILIAAASELAKRSTAVGAIVASLPLVSVLAMIWLWRETGDTERLADYAQTTFWYVLPSLPLFLAMPAMLRAGFGFWPSLGAGIVLTTILYLITAALLARAGIRL